MQGIQAPSGRLLPPAAKVHAEPSTRRRAGLQTSSNEGVLLEAAPPRILARSEWYHWKALIAPTMAATFCASRRGKGERCLPGSKRFWRCTSFRCNSAKTVTRAKQGLAVDSSPAAEGAQSIANVVLPALVCGIIGAVAFCPLSLALKSILAESTQDILRDDMTQYDQNAFVAFGLVLGLFWANTFDVLLSRQRKLYTSVYSEVSEWQSLVEQISLLAGSRGSSDGGQPGSLLREVESYLMQDLRQLREAQALPVRGAGSVVSGDALERLLFATSVGVPSNLLTSVRYIRQARSERLAVLQRSFPLEHYTLLALSALVMLAILIALGAGLTRFEPDGLAAEPGRILTVLAPGFGLLVGLMVMAALILQQLTMPGVGLFGISKVLEEALEELLYDVRGRLTVASTRTSDWD